MISNAAGATATSTFAKSVEAICKQLPHVPTMIWGYVFQHYNRLQRTADPNKVLKDLAMYGGPAIMASAFACSLYWKSQE
jgi:hypothetical protein